MNFQLGVHEGSSLSPYHFALVMDEFTRHIEDDVPWYMLIADDVNVDEARGCFSARLETCDRNNGVIWV